MGADPTGGTGGPSTGDVDIVVPVHGAGAELSRCLASIGRHTDLTRHRLVLVLDGDSGDALQLPAGRVEVLRNPRRLGFVASVNRGMALGDGDVVLLNSDTQVAAGWLGGLQAAAGSAPDVATVTPFSNHATICSLPRFLAENLLPAGHDVDSFAELVARCSLRRYPPLPTGVGVCLYIRRQTLDDVGLFDERSFGLGYGEEGEFCMRAARAGWIHVLGDATFVFHEGQRSFGTSRRRRVATAHRRMRRLHPDYLRQIARFIAQDPLEPLRARVLDALRPPRHGKAARPAVARVSHLVHGWPPWSRAGTELYASWLVRRQGEDREVAVYARITDQDRLLAEAKERYERGVRVRLMVNNFVQRDPISRNALHDRRLTRDFARFLDEQRPDLLHVHHLAGHCATLLHVAARRGIPIVYQLQDWWPICARTNLLHRTRTLCTGPAASKCADCLPATLLPGHRVWNPLFYLVRERWMRRSLRLPVAFIAGSRFIVDSYHRFGMLPLGAAVHVLPYGVPLGDERPTRARDRALYPLRFGYLGSIQPHKGVHLAADAFAEVDPDQATLDIWGDASANPEYTARLLTGSRRAVRLRGSFPEERKGEILSSLDVLIVPSVGLESFGLVVREAAAGGVPALVSRRGALAELLEGPESLAGGFDPDDPEDLRGWIERLVRSPDRVDELRRSLPAVVGADEHAGAIDDVYRSTLAGVRSKNGTARA